jgi:hypothetical protein
MPSGRCLPPPWSIEEHNEACFIVKDATGQALGYFYHDDEPQRRSVNKLLTWMTIMKRALAIIFLIAQLDIAQAVEMGTMGPGSSTCAEFADKMRNNPEIVEPYFFTWAQGYMSGLNGSLPLTKQRDLAAKSIDEEQSFIREFCDQRPLVRYMRAVLVE